MNDKHCVTKPAKLKRNILMHINFFASRVFFMSVLCLSAQTSCMNRAMRLHYEHAARAIAAHRRSVQQPRVRSSADAPTPPAATSIVRLPPIERPLHTLSGTELETQAHQARPAHLEERYQKLVTQLKDKIGSSKCLEALLSATISGHVPLVRQLLIRSLARSPHATCFSLVSYAATPEVVHQFCQIAGRNYYPDSSFVAGIEPLDAIMSGNAEVVQAFLEIGLNINRKIKEIREGRIVKESTLLHYAGNAATAHVLAAAGANVNAHEFDHDTIGSTPLMAAANAGRADVVRYLLSRGADIRAQAYIASEQLTAQTALHRATTGEIVDILLDAGADIEAHVGLSFPPLMIIGHRGHTAAVNRLIDREARIIGHRGGYTPLHMAGNAAIVDLFMTRCNHMLNVNSATYASHGASTPLICAARENRADVVARLLHYQADVNRVDREHATALHYAHSEPVVDFLCKAGADIHALNVEGQTPLLALIEKYKTARWVAIMGRPINANDALIPAIKCMLQHHALALPTILDASQGITILPAKGMGPTITLKKYIENYVANRAKMIREGLASMPTVLTAMVISYLNHIKYTWQPAPMT